MNRAAYPAIALALALAVTGPLQADDPRLVELRYDPDQVVRIEGKPRVQATIRFGEDEVIENVAIGDSQAWQVTPNKRANLLFVKPLETAAATNMTVVTSKRTYLFDLVANPRSRPVYVLSFIYPVDPADAEAATALAARQAASAEEMAAASDPFAVVDPAALNFAWSMAGDAALHPARAYDDGRATFLAWPAGRAVPAILTKNAAGEEGPVNYTVRGEAIVVEGVPREIVLRSGENAARLVNQGPARAQLPLREDPALAQATAQAMEAN